MKKYLGNVFLSRMIQSGIITMAAFGLAHTSQAATQTWKTAANGNWNDASSWTSIVPLVTDSAQFNAAGVNGPETVYLNGNQGVSAVIFANTGATVLLGGTSGGPVNNVLALTGAITVNGGTYDQVVGNGAVTGTSVFTVVLGSNSITDAFWDTNKSWSNIFTTTGSGTYNLSSLFATFAGTDIASNGVVAGQGSFGFTGNTLTWTAVPEPTSALAGLLLGAGLLRRRKK